jgi:two-component system cell cycle sensor histidine kinase/response regulator CckA
LSPAFVVTPVNDFDYQSNDSLPHSKRPIVFSRMSTGTHIDLPRRNPYDPKYYLAPPGLVHAFLAVRVLVRSSGSPKGRQDALDSSNRSRMSKPLQFKFSLLAGALSVGVGTTVLWEWFFPSPPLTSLLFPIGRMRGDTALCFVLLGVSLLAKTPGLPRPLSRIGRACAAIVLMFSSLSITSLVFDWPTHFNSLVPYLSGSARNMPIGSAVNFLCLSFGLILMDASGFWHRLHEAFLHASLAVTTFAIVSYVYAIASLSLSVQYRSTAFHSLVLFLLLGVGCIAARPGRGIALLFRDQSLGGSLMRRLFPAAVLVPATLGWLILEGQRLNLFPGVMSYSLSAVTTIIVFSALVWSTAGSLRRIDLERLRERFQRESMLDSVPALVFYKDSENRYLRVNRAFSEMVGKTKEEIEGKTAFELFPNDADSHWTMDKSVIETGETRRNIVSSVSTPQGIRWLRCDVYPHHDERGHITGIIGFGLDITEAKELQEQVLQSQKMEAVGRLAGGIAHDFNNLLTVILGYSRMSLERLPEQDPIREDLMQIEVAGQRAAALTHQLLAFSRKQVLQLEILDLNSLVENLEKMLGRLIGEDLTVSIHLSPDLGHIKADRTQLEQVILNLAVNSRDAMPKGGRLVIETSNAALGPEYCSQHRSVEPGNYVMLAVSDTGVGMSPEVQARIFEPFFTTKELGRGTGLGLSTVFGIVKQSGGHVWVYSEPGKGTTFKIYFPRTGAQVSSQAVSAAPQSLTGSETILVTEDDRDLRELAAAILSQHGYHVLIAKDAAQAEAISDKHAGMIDLLLTDVVMPLVSGPILADTIIRQRPGIKVVYTSGYTDQAVLEHGLFPDPKAFLAKPYTPSDLARKVRQTLDTRQRVGIA